MYIHKAPFYLISFTYNGRNYSPLFGETLFDLHLMVTDEFCCLGIENLWRHFLNKSGVFCINITSCLSLNLSITYQPNPKKVWHICKSLHSVFFKLHFTQWNFFIYIYIYFLTQSTLGYRYTLPPNVNKNVQSYYSHSWPFHCQKPYFFQKKGQSLNVVTKCSDWQEKNLSEAPYEPDPIAWERHQHFLWLGNRKNTSCCGLRGTGKRDSHQGPRALKPFRPNARSNLNTSAKEVLNGRNMVQNNECF